MANIPTTIMLQFEIPDYKKMLKVKMNTKNALKFYLPLFSTKFDSDFSTYRIRAKLKVGSNRVDVRTDVPMRYLLADLFQEVSDETVVVYIYLSYEGG